METVVPKGYKQTKAGVIPDDWDIVKLKDIATKNSKKNTDGIIKTVFSNSAIHGIVLQNKYFNKDIAQQGNLEGYYIVKSGDFVYNPRISQSAPAGPINRNLHTDRGVVSPLYTVFSAKSDEAIQHLEYFFKSTKWLRYMMSIANYGARHDRMNISNEGFFDMPIPYPKKEERKIIGEILTTWEEAITKQEELIIEKEQLKKGLMQKLLSGEVRFNGFDDEWKKVKLGEVFAERNSRAGEEEYELLAVTMARGVVKRDEVDIKDNSSEDKSNYKLVKINDIAYNTMRMWQGASGVSKYEGIVSPAYTIVYLKKHYDIDFFGYLFKTHRIVFDFYRYSQGLTSDTWNIKYPHFSGIAVKIPTSKAEQSKIVEVLKKSEEEINLLKKELKELKQQKKGLMQKLLTGQVRVSA